MTYLFENTVVNEQDKQKNQDKLRFNLSYVVSFTCLTGIALVVSLIYMDYIALGIAIVTLVIGVAGIVTIRRDIKRNT